MRPEASIKLQDLRYVVALADHGHFGRAAETCEVSQPTLSGQIIKLERQLGVVLFERTTKSVRTTAVGEEIAGRARQVLADIEAIVSVGQRLSAPLTGSLSLGVIPTLGPYLLPWLVPALREFPGLRLAVREDLTAPLLDRLETHRLDAALMALPIVNDRLETLPLFYEPFWFAEPKCDETMARTIIMKDDLRGRRLLLLTEGHCLREQALAVCQTADRDADGDFRATSLQTVLQMVATGLGSTLLPAMARGEASGRSITTRPLEAGIGRRIGLVWRRGSPARRDVDLLARVVRDHLPDSVEGL